MLIFRDGRVVRKMPARSRMDPRGGRSGIGGMDGNPQAWKLRSTAKFPHAEFFPPPPSPRGPSPLDRALARGSPRARPVLAGRAEHGRAGAAGSLPALVSGLRLDAAQSDLDDGDPLLGLLSHHEEAFENYPLFLFAGMVPWSFLSISLNDCAFSIINNEGLIRKIYLPKLVFPLVRVLIALVTFVLSLGCVVSALVAAGCAAVVRAALSAGGDCASRRCSLWAWG